MPTIKHPKLTAVAAFEIMKESEKEVQARDN